MACGTVFVDLFPVMPNVVKNFSNFSTSLPGDHALISAFASSRGQDLDSDLDDEYSPSAQEDSSDETMFVVFYIDSPKGAEVV